MNFNDLEAIIGTEPLFDTGILLAGSDQSPNYIRRQLSEWVTADKIRQLRRGLYALSPPHRKTRAHPFLTANRLELGSYVSLQSALAFWGMIPEHVPVTTSVSSGRNIERKSLQDRYLFRHVKPELHFGYLSVQVAGEQSAFVATAEKALLDLVYLQPGGDSLVYLDSLRLQNLEALDTGLLLRLVDRADKPKLRRAARLIEKMKSDAPEYLPL